MCNKFSPVFRFDMPTTPTGGVTCKLLCIRHLTEIRVAVFVTLKVPKMLIHS